MGLLSGIPFMDTEICTMSPQSWSNQVRATSAVLEVARDQCAVGWLMPSSCRLWFFIITCEMKKVEANESLAKMEFSAGFARNQFMAFDEA